MTAPRGYDCERKAEGKERRADLADGWTEGWTGVLAWLIDCMMELIDETGGVFSGLFLTCFGVSPLHGTGTRDKKERREKTFHTCD